ncbi:bifunctional proline dehydrogenase/L-glutamate gamma-semialdehyde dehydrogenase PutA [Marinicella sp. W31]|uniref:bifunctional proline dehydrogenase/L-glutamate gamma-semialdehyde dehydrogenase PutA n=1 Tax=Marinicella sp. W31 TaxID=3023713 RepID=UPI003757361D
MKHQALPFSEQYLTDEDVLVNQLLEQAQTDSEIQTKIQQLAQKLVTQVRSQLDEMDPIDAFMKQYDLSSKEGILLMCLAEALLRIPDKNTADKLIRDKILDADWKSHLGKSDSLFVNASTWGLMLTGKIIDVDPEKKGLSRAMDKFINKTGEPVIRQGINKAMQMMGKQFVMGRTIKEATKRAQKKNYRDYRYSYDMLGEAALTQADADRYLESYLRAIQHVAATNSKLNMDQAASVSIKLSALHPRYDIANIDRVMQELAPRVLQIAQAAKTANVAITVDAEEADRLELSLHIFAWVYAQLDDYAGFGLVVQAYQKRALPVLKWLTELAQKHGRKIPLRLVKGAYWDTEIKRAQEQGLINYPVFTRKANTDVSYIACARYLLNQRDLFYPQFATHNANSVAAIHTFADGSDGYEFQRLHGMGQTLHGNTIATDGLNTPCRIYAPVGSHEDLLPYLVRRLLENGANTSFVNRLSDTDLPIEEITRDPVLKASKQSTHKHPALPLPAQIFEPHRRNSVGHNIADIETLEDLQRQIEQHRQQTYTASCLIPGFSAEENRPVMSPAQRSFQVGEYSRGSQDAVDVAINNAQKAFRGWRDTNIEQRVNCLHAFADLLETHTSELIYLLRHEAGKTLNDSISELREAVDFCHYYALHAQQLMTPQAMPGPTGESNVLLNQGKGIFACISPWNFPLAIFTGQIVAALVTGNCVIAKPAEQTSLIAWKTTQLMHQAGFPTDVMQLILGEGRSIGNLLCQHTALTGVIFTGSTQTAHIINQNLAQRNAAIATFIAETGGQNCMIADSSTLPEQLVNDVIQSAFLSAGQRCSALRVLYVQEDIADKVMELLKGAMQELSVDHPQHFATDLGPLIDQKALNGLEHHAQSIQQHGQLIMALDKPDLDGYYFPPHVVEIPSISVLEQEVFGPFLHVIRYSAKNLDEVITDINNTGYGLTCGIHSRINESIEYIATRIDAGNCYINRNMIGAVVGVQPFGGMGLSGTGPKAGGPGYLHAFVTEKTVTNNISAVGGNADLLELNED